MRGNHKSRTPNHKPRGGGGSRARTGGIQLAKLALYQLSYAPGVGNHRLCDGRMFSKKFIGPYSRSGRDTTLPCSCILEEFSVFTIAQALLPGCSLERR